MSGMTVPITLCPSDKELFPQKEISIAQLEEKERRQDVG